MPTQSPGMSRRSLVKQASVAAAAAAAGGLAWPATASAEELQHPRCADLIAEPIPPQVEAREGFLDVAGGARLWYWDTGGRGPAVLLSHPASGSALAWPYQQPVFAAAGYRVIAFSRRGYYNSTRSAPGQPAGRGADDIHALLDHLEVSKVHLIGAALGGYYVTDYALEHPERVRSLMIVSSFMGITAPDFAERHTKLRPEGFNSMPHSFRELGPYYRAHNATGTAEWEAMSDLSLSGSPMFQTSLPLSWERLETLSVRTLIIAGDADLYLPPPMARMAWEHLPRAGMITFDKVGHCANWERPADFNTYALHFLRGRPFPRPICV